MKLFAVGNYDKFAVFALVIAETEKEALEKMKNLKDGDTIGGFGDNDCTIDEIDLEGCLGDLKLTKKVTEIPSGIYMVEN